MKRTFVALKNLSSESGGGAARLNLLVFRQGDVRIRAPFRDSMRIVDAVNLSDRLNALRRLACSAFVLMAMALSLASVGWAQQNPRAPLTGYYSADDASKNLFKTADAAARSRAYAYEDHCYLGPFNIDLIYDHVEQQFLGPNTYDSTWLAYYKRTDCHPAADGQYHNGIYQYGPGAVRVLWCTASLNYGSVQNMPTPPGQGVCPAPPLDLPKTLGPPCPGCGNPINPATGNKYQPQTEYRGSGPFPLTFAWSYNSLLASKIPIIAGLNDETLGANRRHSYSQQILMQASSAITTAYALRPDGKTFNFLLSGTNIWIADADVSDRLIRLVDALNATTGWQYIRQSDEAVENYDANGRLTSIVSRSGLTQTMGYSPIGRLTSVTDDFGHGLSFTYDALGRINGMTDPAGLAYTFAYDNHGNLTTVTYPDGAIRSYLYEFPGNPLVANALTGIVDENGGRFATFQYEYDYGKAVSTEHAGGVEKYSVNYNNGANITDPLLTSRTLGFVNLVGVPRNTDTTQPCASVGCSGTKTESKQYDANGNVSQRADFKGNVTNYVYDLSRNLETSRTETAGTAAARTITTTWNANYRLPATITEPAAGGGSKVTNHTYDAAGNLTQRTITTPQGSRTWTWTYDVYGRVLTATDPRGHTSVNTYYPNDPAQGLNRGQLASVTNAAGHTTTIGNYNAHGQAQTMTDPNGLVTTLGYDNRQRLTTRTVGGETTTYTYDAVGQLTKVTLPDGSYLNYTYDPAHRLTQIQDGLGNRLIYTLDNIGNRIKEDAADPGNALARTRSRVYDALNRLKQDIGGANPASEITQYAYDDNNNLTSTTDPLSRVTGNSYDALNRLIQVTDPASGTTQYQYDAQDNLTQVTDPKNLATTYTYNGFNDMVSQVSPDTGTTTFTYDAAGNLLTRTDARNVTASYSYDVLNRVTTITYPDETVTYTYDSCGNGKGRLCTLTDKTGTTAYSYDLHGRITAKSQTVGGLTQTVSYGYNAAGQLVSMTLPSGKSVGYTYLNNRITGVTYDGETVVKNADYEPFGPIGEWTWGNDSVASPNKHTRYFDLDGRTTKIESGMGGTAALDPAVIVYDAASRITALQRLTAGNVDPARSATYGYDNLDRLTSVTPGAGNPAASQSYTYDAVGNRLSNTVAGNLTTYSYGATSHRLNALSGATSKSYGYDAAGNRVSDGSQTWTYGGNNRPTTVSVTGNPLTTVQSGINALGQRVTKSVNGVMTRFVYDEAGRLIGEYQSDGTRIREHLWLNDLPVGVVQ
jgi:YD repeat-containing protein